MIGKQLLRLAWPEGITTLLGVGLVAWPPARAAAAPFLQVYPIVVLVAGLALGLRFGRGRLVAGLICLVAADRALLWYSLHPLVQRPAMALVAVLLPADLALLAFLPEGSVLWRLGAAWIAMLAAEGVGILALSRVAPDSVAYVVSLPLFPVPILDRIPLPQVAIITFVAAAVLVAFHAAGRADPTPRGLLWATVAGFLALTASDPATRTLYFSTAGLALVVAMFEASYALAFHDDLTGLPARRAFNQALAALDGDYVVAMVDVDHFKQFNDRHGHDVGDQVLKLVANRLAAVGGGGKGFRYGGEEFSVIFPLVSLDAATPHLEALRENIQATTFTLRGKDRPRKPDTSRRGRSARRRDISVTVSIGAAAGNARTGQPAAVVKQADQALYRAKDAGRNRLVTAD